MKNLGFVIRSESKHVADVVELRLIWSLKDLERFAFSGDFYSFGCHAKLLEITMSFLFRYGRHVRELGRASPNSSKLKS
jgi:hypothetical protein